MCQQNKRKVSIGFHYKECICYHTSMHKLLALWRAYVRGGLPAQPTIGQLRKLQFINIVVLIGIVVCLPFGLNDIGHFLLVGSVELTACLLFMMAGLSLRILHRPRLATNIILLAIFMLSVMLFMTAGGDGAGILWLLIFPPLLFFLEDWKVSIVWACLLIVTISVLFFSGHADKRYNAVMYQHAVYAIVAISIVVFFYQEINRQAEVINANAKRELAEKNEKLNQANQELAVAKSDVEKQVVERTRSFIKEHARLDASVSSLPIGFILTDEKLFIASINTEAKRILGDNVSYSDVLRNEIKLEESIKRAIDTRSRINVEEAKYRGLFLQITVAPIIVSKDQEVIGAIILLQDVTEKRQIARSRDEFFLVASHELRTPLTIVEGNISMVKDHFLDQFKNVELNHMINNAYDSTKRLIYIVNQLLQVSSLELGQVEFHQKPADVVAACQAVLDQYAKAAKDKGIQLLLHPDTQSLFALTDTEHFQQILGSLVDNAVRNTEHGSVEIAARHYQDHIEAIVRDTGKGIPEELQKELFNKFNQTSQDILTRETGQSIGLSLYLARLLADKMGAKLYLRESVPDKGSVFVIELPLAT